MRQKAFVDQQNAMLSFRNGNYNVAYGNFFIRAGGIRIREASHLSIYNNFFYLSGMASTNTTTTRHHAGHHRQTYPIEVDDVTEFKNPFWYQVDLNVQYNTFIDSAAVYVGTKANKIRNVYGK